MKTTALVLALLLFALETAAGGPLRRRCRRESRPSNRDNVVAVPAPASAVAQLNASAAKPVDRPEALVRPASLLVQERFLNRPWTEVRDELTKHGVVIPEGRDVQYGTIYEIPFLKNALTLGGVSYDLVLEFDVDTRTKEQAENARPGSVGTATASLHAEVGMSPDKAIATGVFPRGSPLAKALDSEERRENDGGLPILKRIEISYDLLRHHRETEYPYAYHVNLYFAEDTRKDWRNSLFLTVYSEEDLPRDSEGRPVRNFTGWRLTGLFDVQYWGGSERSE